MFQKRLGWTGSLLVWLVVVVMFLAAIQVTAHLTAQAPGPAAGPGQAGANSRPTNPLIAVIRQWLDSESDVSQEDRDQGRQILREADTILTDVKEENRRALESLRQPPQTQPNPEQKDTAAGDYEASFQR